MKMRYVYIWKNYQKRNKRRKSKTSKKINQNNSSIKIIKKDKGLLALRLLSQNLEWLGVETTIEVNEILENQDADLTSLQLITNGIINKKYMICIFNKEKKEKKKY